MLPSPSAPFRPTTTNPISPAYGWPTKSREEAYVCTTTVGSAKPGPEASGTCRPMMMWSRTGYCVHKASHVSSTPNIPTHARALRLCPSKCFGQSNTTISCRQQTEVYDQRLFRCKTSCSRSQAVACICNFRRCLVAAGSLHQNWLVQS